MVKASELRDLSLEELEETEQKISRELFELRNDFMGSKKIEKHRISECRKNRARVLTILTEKRNKQSGR